MLDQIRKGLLAGFGAIFITKKKVEEVTRKLVAEGKLNQEDAQRLAKELLATGERQWAELEKSVSEAVTKGLKGLDIGKGEEIQELKTRMDNLEKRLSEAENSVQNRREPIDGPEDNS
ncbi:MAG: phasin family protein [Deltaproteobacteria bacterium]|nr:phasin family protein [Deltaproteobacteria bacterium]